MMSEEDAALAEIWMDDRGWAFRESAIWTLIWRGRALERRITKLRHESSDGDHQRDNPAQILRKAEGEVLESELRWIQDHLLDGGLIVAPDIDAL